MPRLFHMIHRRARKKPPRAGAVPPSGSIPGDSIRACDNTADGWGIEAWLDINRDGTIDRIASTRGHNAPYRTSWKSGDIPEGTPVTVNGGIVLEKGGALWSKA